MSVMNGCLLRDDVPPVCCWGCLHWPPQSQAQTTLGPVTIGGGLRTSFVSTEPSSGPVTNQFLVNDARLYIVPAI
jgi:hypothetical protein